MGGGVRTVDVVLGIVLLAVLVPCVIRDLRERVIPNAVLLPGAVAAVALGLVLDADGQPGRLLAGALAAGFLLVAALISPSGMGMGDVKLLGVIGLCTGEYVVIALLVSLVGGMLAGAGVAVTRGVAVARVTHLPFAPFLALGGVAAAVVAIAAGGGSS
jgi:leader peptidase (prepilin peptidase) / N-methyltransferase